MIRVEVHWLALTLGALLFVATSCGASWLCVLALLKRAYEPACCAWCLRPIDDGRTGAASALVARGAAGCCVLCLACEKTYWAADRIDAEFETADGAT